MTVIPTGIDVARFAAADRVRARVRLGLPPGAFVVGHVGRLAPEKNLAFLGAAVGRFLAGAPAARFLVVGDGPAAGALAAAAGNGRVLATGRCGGRALREAYRAMDLFVFASRTETQGMVLAEAMAAGLPVVALDAPAVRELVRPGINGELLPATAPPEVFADAVVCLARDPAARRRLSHGARTTAAGFDRGRSAARMLAFYAEVRRATRPRRNELRLHPWAALAGRVGLEWELLAARARTFAGAVTSEPSAAGG
jgi:glycosyltransferase involved in cell wall biosynthesis